MTDYSDVYTLDSDSADGNAIVQVQRRFMDGANRTLSPEERCALLDTLAHGNVGDTAEKLGLRYMHIMYCRQEDGLKATIMI